MRTRVKRGGGRNRNSVRNSVRVCVEEGGRCTAVLAETMVSEMVIDAVMMTHMYDRRFE